LPIEGVICAPPKIGNWQSAFGNIGFGIAGFGAGAAI